MTTFIEACPPGTEVCIGPETDPILGTVLAVTVRGSGGNGGYSLQYHVAWFQGTTRHVEWLDACEVWRKGGPLPRTIGFAWGDQS